MKHKSNNKKEKPETEIMDTVRGAWYNAMEETLVFLHSKKSLVPGGISFMKRSEINKLKEKMDQLELHRADGTVGTARKSLKDINKMSRNFIIPLVLFYFVIGLLLILLKQMVTNVAAWVVAIGLAAAGGWLVWRYFKSSMERRIAGADLAVGLVVLLGGILLMTSPTDMEDVFPKIWGLSLIFGGFLKVQYAFDEKTLDINRWWIMLIFAAASLVIGILALMNETIFGDNQHLAIGIFMIGEAILDTVTYILLLNGKKRQTAETIAPVAPASHDVPTPQTQINEDQ